MSRTGDLELLRSKLLKSLGAVEPKDLPRISRELRAVNLELSQLNPDAEADPIDDLKERRAARRATAQG